MEIKTLANVGENIVMIDRELWTNKVKSVFPNSVIEIVARKEKKEKSRPYEKWYWGVLIPIQCSWYDIDDKDWMHEINLFQHAPRIQEGFDGKEIRPYKRTSDKEGKKMQMDRDEIFRFIEEIVLEERTKGHDIPDPNEH